MDPSTSSDMRQPTAGVDGPTVVQFRPAGAGPADASDFVERRQDYQERVRYQCRLAGVPIRRGPDGDIYFLVVKPVFDVAVAALLVVLLAPLLLLIAAAIKLQDGGPIFFVQSRTGYLGRRFPLLKFRTMIVNADAAKASLAHLNLHAAEGSPDFKIANDPRVTPLGHWLRAWSLDELPNLINVLRGELSLVGPRPTSFDVSTYASRHLTRLAVRPGITGLWQISGRALLGFDRRCDLDEEYIRSAGLRVDLLILARTVGAVMRRHGAL